MNQLLEWKRLYTAGSSVKADLIIFRTLLFVKTFGWEDLAARVLLVTSTFICAPNHNWNNFYEMGDDNEGVDPQHDYVARAYLPNYLSHRYVSFIHLGETNQFCKKETYFADRWFRTPPLCMPREISRWDAAWRGKELRNLIDHIATPRYFPVSHSLRDVIEISPPTFQTQKINEVRVWSMPGTIL